MKNLRTRDKKIHFRDVFTARRWGVCSPTFSWTFWVCALFAGGMCFLFHDSGRRVGVENFLSKALDKGYAG